ncbi:MAG: secretin N-terminal domain-containing protein [Pseudomonadota bacterium]
MKHVLKSVGISLMGLVLGCSSAKPQEGQEDISNSQANQSNAALDDETSDVDSASNVNGETTDFGSENQFSGNAPKNISNGNKNISKNFNSFGGEPNLITNSTSNSAIPSNMPMTSNSVTLNAASGLNSAINSSINSSISSNLTVSANAATPNASMPVPTAPTIKEQVVPPKSETTVVNAGPRLTWVGFDYRPLDAQVRVEIVSEGVPEYDVLQEVNKKQQPELVVRLYKTTLKKKVRRDIDCSEFKSPVSFIRMREDLEKSYTDVVMTLRDKVVPRLFADKGNILITFSIPQRYFGNSAIGMSAESRGSFLSGFRVQPIIQSGSKQPLKASKIPDPTKGAFSQAPALGGDPLQAESIAPSAPSEASQVAPEAAVPMAESTSNPSQSANSQLPANAAISNTGASGLNGSNFGDMDGGNVKLENQHAQAANEYPTLQGAESENLDGTQNEGLNNSPENIPDEEEQLDDTGNDFSLQKSLELPTLLFEYQIAAVGNDGYALDEDLDAVSPKNSSNGATGAQTPFPQNAAGGNGGAINSMTPNSAVSNGTNSKMSLNGNAATGMYLNGSNQMKTSGAVTNAAPLAPNASVNSASLAPINTAGADSEFVDLTGPDTMGAESVAGAEKSSGGQVTRPVKLEFTGARLSDVLKVLSEENGTNFIFTDEAVKDLKVNVSLKDVSWTDALGAILDTYGLGYSQLPGNVVRIDKFANLKGQKIDIMAAKVEALKLQRTRQMVYKLSFAKSADIEKSITRLIDTGLDPRMKITGDTRTNTVVIEAVPELLSKFKSIIEKLDTPTPQVRIAVKVVEASESFNYDFGVKWGTNLLLDSARGLGFGSLPFPKTATSSVAIDVPSAKAPTAQIGARLGSLNNAVNLDAVIAFSEAKQNAKILQNTSVLVLDQQPALIQQGLTDYFDAVDNSSATTSTERKSSPVSIQYNLTLNVTPSVSADGSVGMNVKLNADTPVTGKAKTAVAGMANKKLETWMLKKSGETAVIGGVYTTRKEEVVKAVPFFSKIPIIGWLFKSTVQEMQKTELIIFVTPTIVNGKSDDRTRGASYVDLPQTNSTYAAQGSLEPTSAVHSMGAEGSGSQLNTAATNSAQANSAQANSAQANASANSSQSQGANPQGLENPINSSSESNSTNNATDNSTNSSGGNGEEQL